MLNMCNFSTRMKQGSLGKPTSFRVQKEWQLFYYSCSIFYPLGYFVFDRHMGSSAAWKYSNFQQCGDQLLASFSGSLFDWSRAWELTTSDSLPIFFSSLLCNQYLFSFSLLFLFFIFYLLSL